MSRFAKASISIALIVAVLTTSGCGTIVASSRWPEPKVFGGIREDWRILTEPGYSDEFAIFPFLDLPMSFVLDLALLPVNLILALFDSDEGGPDSSDPPSR